MRPELERIIDDLISEQTMFVAWWNANVSVRESPGDNQFERSSADLRSTSISRAAPRR
jgi:hypothetical protein